MLQVSLIAPETFRVEDVPVPGPGPGQALIRVRTIGICGSDLHSYEGRHPFVTYPIVPGHEFSGDVAALGEGSGERIGLAIGQRVTVEPSVVCGECYNCRTGRYNICDDLKVMGFQTVGSFAEFILVPAEKVVPLADGVGYEDGAMLEPLAVGIHAVDRAALQPGGRLVIIGGGTIGLMALMAAKAAGLSVLVSDLVDFRLEVANNLGADRVVNAGRTDLAAAIKAFSSDGADAILECVGTAYTVRKSIELARKGSRIVIVGVVGGDVPLPLSLVQDRELELVGDLMYRRPDFERAHRLILDGKANLTLLRSGSFPLAEAQEAFHYVLSNRERALKVFLNVG